MLRFDSQTFHDQAGDHPGPYPVFAYLYHKAKGKNNLSSTDSNNNKNKFANFLHWKKMHDLLLNHRHLEISCFLYVSKLGTKLIFPLVIFPAWVFSLPIINLLSFSFTYSTSGTILCYSEYVNHISLGESYISCCSIFY